MSDANNTQEQHEQNLRDLRMIREDPGWALTAVQNWRASEARCTALARALERYANLDTWQHVPSPESETAWVKTSGHPTPWVDAQEALAAAPRGAE